MHPHCNNKDGHLHHTQSIRAGRPMPAPFWSQCCGPPSPCLILCQGALVHQSTEHRCLMTSHVIMRPSSLSCWVGEMRWLWGEIPTPILKGAHLGRIPLGPAWPGATLPCQGVQFIPVSHIPLLQSVLEKWRSRTLRAAGAALTHLGLLCPLPDHGGHHGFW